MSSHRTLRVSLPMGCFPVPACRAPISPGRESPWEDQRVQTRECTAAAHVSVGLTHEVGFQDTFPKKQPPTQARIRGPKRSLEGLSARAETGGPECGPVTRSYYARSPFTVKNILKYGTMLKI